MTVYTTNIASLIALYQSGLAAMGAGDSEVAYVYTGTSPTDEASILLNRIANLTWAESQTDTAIGAQITTLQNQLSQESVNQICGDISQVSQADAVVIGLIEDLEIALGKHVSCLAPGQTYYRWTS